MSWPILLLHFPLCQTLTSLYFQEAQLFLNNSLNFSLWPFLFTFVCEKGGGFFVHYSHAKWMSPRLKNLVWSQKRTNPHSYLMADFARLAHTCGLELVASRNLKWNLGGKYRKYIFSKFEISPNTSHEMIHFWIW